MSARPCAQAGDIWNNIAIAKSVTIGNQTHVSLRSVPTKPPRTAVAPLRAAMPEVVVVKQQPINVDLRGTGTKALETAGGIAGIAVLIGLVHFLYRAFT